MLHSVLIRASDNSLRRIYHMVLRLGHVCADWYMFLLWIILVMGSVLPTFRVGHIVMITTIRDTLRGVLVLSLRIILMMVAPASSSQRMVDSGATVRLTMTSMYMLWS